MRNWIWRIGFLGFGLSVGWCVYHLEILPSGPFHWDEAAHSLKGVLIAHDLQTHDWLSFFYDTYRQVYWPPLHSWLLGVAFLLHHPTVELARQVSLVLFLLAALMVYCAALQLPLRYRETAATIAATLFLTSPLILSLAGQAMLEVPGLFFICLTIFVFAWLNNGPHPDVAHVWLGLGMTGAYFIRTNYGILLLLVWAVTVFANGGFKAILSVPVCMPCFRFL